MNDVNVYYVAVWGGRVTDRKNTFRTHVLHPDQQAVSLPLRECVKLQHLDRCTRKGFQLPEKAKICYTTVLTDNPAEEVNKRPPNGGYSLHTV